jgi:putative transposase
MDAIFYLNKTGCQWRHLPNDFPHWKAVYRYFLRLNSKGVFEKINSRLSRQYRITLGRQKDPSLLCIDSQSVDGDVNLDQKGIDGNKKVKGRKRHIVTDILGLIFLCLVTAANIADIHPAKEIVKELESQARLEKILVDSA